MVLTAMAYSQKMVAIHTTLSTTKLGLILQHPSQHGDASEFWLHHYHHQMDPILFRKPQIQTARKSLGTIFTGTGPKNSSYFCLFTWRFWTPYVLTRLTENSSKNLQNLFHTHNKWTTDSIQQQTLYALCIWMSCNMNLSLSVIIEIGLTK